MTTTRKTIIRGLIYVGLAALTHLQGTIKADMTPFEAVMAVLGATIAGLTVIRAYLDQTQSREDSKHVMTDDELAEMQYAELERRGLVGPRSNPGPVGPIGVAGPAGPE